MMRCTPLRHVTPAQGSLLALSLILASACSDLADEPESAVTRAEQLQSPLSSLGSYDLVDGEGRATLLGLMYDVQVKPDGDLVIKETDAVLPSGEAVPSWSYTLGKPVIRREGSEDRLPLADRATLSVRNNRLTRDWGAIRELYDHNHRSLKHSIAISAAPRGSGALLLELPLRSAGVKHEAGRAGEVKVYDEGGHERLVWSGLVVTDARGKELPATFERGDDALTIRVDLKGASFPILVDPLATNPATTINGEQEGGNLGFSIAGPGDVNRDGFADLLVGQPNYTHNNIKSGRAVLFLGSATGIKNTAAWSVVTNKDNDRVGESVSGVGDGNKDGFADFAVGAPLAETSINRNDEGIVWVYAGGEQRSDGQLSITRAWTRAGGVALRRLGQRIASAGDVNCDGNPDLMIAAFDITNTSTIGRVEIHSGIGTAAFYSNSFSTRLGQSHGFGSAIASAGHINGRVNTTTGVKCDSIIVGDFSFDNGATATANYGRIYIYGGTPTGMGSTPATRTGTVIGQRFGRAVAGGRDINGDGLDDVLITSQLADNSGRVDAHFGNASTLISNVPNWTVSGGTAQTFFGLGLALLQDVNNDGRPDIAIGANNANVGRGRVTLYFNSSNGVATMPSWTYNGAITSDRIGTTITPLGDVNGDRGPDFAVAAASATIGETGGAGRIYVFHGETTPPACTINGSPYASGATNPSNICEVCNPAISTTAWSLNNGALCTDNNLCTTGDVCNAGACVGSPVVCAPSSQECQVNACNPSTGQCALSAQPNGASCTDTDNLPCTSGACRSGRCSSVVTDGCLINGQCVGALVASPGNDCSVCNPDISRNRYTNAAGTTVCDDRNSCTGDGLCQTGQCVGAPPTNNGASCEDGDACTSNTTCTNGACTNGTNICI